MYPLVNIDSPLPLYEVRELSMEEALLVLAAEKDLLDRQIRDAHWLDDASRTPEVWREARVMGIA